MREREGERALVEYQYAKLSYTRPYQTDGETGVVANNDTRAKSTTIKIVIKVGTEKSH